LVIAQTIIIWLVDVDALLLAWCWSLHSSLKNVVTREYGYS
jgi:hypothetical protein